MKRTIHKVTVSALVLLVAAIASQTSFQMFKEVPLYGKNAGGAGPVPRLTVSSWFRGTFQKDFEAWFNRRLGFRGAFVKTNNQIYYTILGAVTCNAKHRILLGKNGCLYEQGYVSAYVSPARAEEKELEIVARDLRSLQDALYARNKAFLFVISPSKAELFPENLPAACRRSSGRASSNRARLVQLLDKEGVHYLDFQELFEEQKRDSKYPLYPRAGTHWSVFSAFLATQEIWKKLQEQVGDPANVLNVESVEWGRARYSDNDLGRLLNVWAYRGNDDLLPYPNPAPISSDARRLSILIVGGNFCETLAIHLQNPSISKGVTILWYYKSRIRYPPGDFVDFSRETFNLEEDLRGRDAVIIELNAAALAQQAALNGYVEDALKVLVPLRGRATPGSGSDGAETSP